MCEFLACSWLSVVAVLGAFFLMFTTPARTKRPPEAETVAPCAIEAAATRAGRKASEALAGIIVTLGGPQS